MAEQPDAMDETIPPPSPPPEASAPPGPESGPAAVPPASPPPESSAAPRKPPESPVVAASSTPEPATIVVERPEQSSPNLPPVPPSPNPPPPPAPSRAPSASPAASSPSSRTYVEATPVPANDATPLPPPISQPSPDASAAVVITPTENKAVVVNTSGNKAEVLVERRPENDTQSEAPNRAEVVVEKPGEPLESERERVRVVEPIPVQDTGPVEEQAGEVARGIAEDAPVVVVEPKFDDEEVARPVQRAATVTKNVAFEPALVAGRVPTKVVVEDNSIRVQPATRTFQDIPSEVPPVIISSTEPTRYVDPEVRLSRLRFRDRIRQGLHPGYWRSLFRRRNRERPEEHLRPRRRDRIRAKFLSRAALAILIGRKPTTVVKPIVEEAATAPRGRHHHHWSKWDALKRLLFLKRHDYAHRRHSEKAELHEEYRRNAERENFTEAEWRHAERQARHQRKAIYHAEKQVRGRRRYTDEEILASTAEYPVPATRQDDRLGYAARHLREARRNLEANIERGQRQVRRHERRIRHPVRRLERDVQNLELQQEKARKEIDELTAVANEHRGETREANDRAKIQEARDREEKVQRNLEVARQRLRNSRDHVERDDVHRVMESSRQNGNNGEVVETVATEPEKSTERGQISRPLLGTALDGNSQSSRKRTLSPVTQTERLYYGNTGQYPLYVQSTGFKRQQELSGESPAAHARSRSSSQSSASESHNSATAPIDRHLPVRSSSSSSTGVTRSQSLARESPMSPHLAPSAAYGLRNAPTQSRLRTSTSLSYATPTVRRNRRGWSWLFKRRKPSSNAGVNNAVQRGYADPCPTCGRSWDRFVIPRSSGSLRSVASSSSSALSRASSRESFMAKNRCTRPAHEDLWGAQSFRLET